MTLLRAAALAAVLAAPVLVPTRADAQILRRVRERAADAAGRAVDRAADRAIDRATGRPSTAPPATAAPADAAPVALPGAAVLPGGGALPGLATGGGTGRSVDFRTLAELLPSTAGGFTRGEATGSRNAAMGMEASEAHAEYRAGDVRARLTITDIGTMRGMADGGLAWMNGMTIDTESSAGFERTARLDEHPLYLKETRSGRTSGEATLVVSERFVVRAEVEGAGANVAQALVEGVDRARLASLAGPRVTPAEPTALRALLPAEVGAGARTSGEASRTSLMGLTTSQATATYGTGDAAVTLTVTDYLDAASLTAFAWMAGTYDRQTDTGFERATRYEGHPSVESETRNGAVVSSEMQVVVGQRFLVSASGDVPFAAVREALARVDLSALARLAAGN